MRVRRSQVFALPSFAAVVAMAGLALTGCGHTPAKASSSPTTCGTGRTAANVPVAIEITRGSVTCTAAMAIERDYAKAVDEGKAPGNGGGGPVRVDGWTCQGFPTPEVLNTGNASKCVKPGQEILAVLNTTSS